MSVPVRELARRHGVSPTKALGQNFLVDPNLARAIAADAALEPGSRVVEVGAGFGSLTVALASTGAGEVLAIEFDRGLIPALQEATAGLPAVRVLHADATKLDWAKALPDGPWTLAANLPYNVGTSIVLRVLEDAPTVTRLVVMVQREVGERLVASPGDPAAGAISLRVAYRAAGALVRRVPPEVFWPRPSVGSVVVRLDRLGEPPVVTDEEALWRVVRGAFAQRRKNMRNALRRLDVPDPDGVLARAGVSALARPETLGLQEFARIVEVLQR